MGDMLSKAEIDALLGGDTPGKTGRTEEELLGTLTAEEQDVLGEVGNISMGTAATTLYALLGERVSITTPFVTVSNWREIASHYERPCVGIHVSYVEGLEGSNVLILKQNDVKTISSLMMGEEVVTIGDEEAVVLTELDMSAIAEAMNQMVGSSSTSLSTLINRRIDINTPQAFIVDFSGDDFLDDLPGDAEEPVVSISFRMQIGDLIDSQIMQVLPLSFGRDLVEIVQQGLESGMTPDHQVPEPEPMPMIEVVKEKEREVVMSPAPIEASPAAVSSVHARKAEFTDFESFVPTALQKGNMGLIMDVPMEVSVELGRTSKKIKEILEFTPGTIVELDKLAGEPIDVLVNGKFIATGEVVVIEENFCIRIVDIISPENRI